MEDACTTLTKLLLLSQVVAMWKFERFDDDVKAISMGLARVARAFRESILPTLSPSLLDQPLPSVFTKQSLQPCTIHSMCKVL